MRRSIGALLLAGVLAGIPSGAIAAPREGDVSPAFRLPDLEGRTLDTADLSGKVYSLHFFALWCEPCVESLSAIERAAARHGGRGYRAVIVAVGQRQSIETLREFAKKRGLEVTVLYDADGTVQKLFGVGVLPHNVIVARDGKIHHAGSLLPSSFAEKIGRLLGERKGR